MDLYSPRHFLAIHHGFHFTTKTSEKFKQLSSIDETLITGALSTASLSTEDLNGLTNLTTQLITFCKDNKITPDNINEHKIETEKRTKAELFQLFLTKFRKDLL